MIRCRLYIPGCNWNVSCYFAVSCYHIDEITRSLKEIGCEGEDFEKAEAMLKKCDLDSGMCYSNPEKRKSVLVTALTSSPSEFFNSICHETGHLATHIALADDLDLTEEEVRYIQGDIAGMLYPYCHILLCCNCRNYR